MGAVASLMSACLGESGGLAGMRDDRNFVDGRSNEKGTQKCYVTGGILR
jgi:hypothetical protein